MKDVMKKGSFNLRKWKTNSSSLQLEWAREETSDLKLLVNCEKVLGYVWENKEDKLKIPIPEVPLNSDQDITKRKMLKIIGKVYDPIGFINPFTVTSKLLMQESWRAGVDWDSPLPEDLQRRFKDWCDDLKYIENITVDRHYFNEFSFKEISNVQLHCFCDSSQKAYGAVIYLRYVKDDEIRTSFVISKSRIAPLKRITLPRLELMGALIGSRLSQYILKTLDWKITDVFYWTDSTIVIHWIKDDPDKWKPFICNRVVEIQEKTDPSSWNFCPGEENPADLLTRGERSLKLKENLKWNHGPTIH